MMIERLPLSAPRLSPNPRRVLVLGATGTTGRSTVRALIERGHQPVCFLRPRKRAGGGLEGAVIRYGDVTDPTSIVRDCFRGERFGALVSCMASRTGAPKDAWAIDHKAHEAVLTAAVDSGISHMVLLSAICVQKPRLAFQHAKLAFEEILRGSGVTYSIVRPTALFKSLSGQIERLRRGKPFVVFGDGALTSCKPISSQDLANYLADCLDDKTCYNRILPIGGPGEAITPRQQGECLFALLGLEPRFRHVPVTLLDAVAASLKVLARVAPALEAKAEFAQIARYYATESMLALDPLTGRYNANATRSVGSETLFDFYARAIRGEVSIEREELALF